MLPLQSNTTPTESGASSLENWLRSCSLWSSKTLKFSFSSPVTKRFMGSVTVTGISTRVLSTRMLALGTASARTEGLGRGSMVTWAHSTGAKQTQIELIGNSLR